MRKTSVILTYIFAFWIVLPAALVITSLTLDQHLHLTEGFSFVYLITGLLLAGISLLLLVSAIVQFFRFSRRLPISAMPPYCIIQCGLYALIRHPIYLFYTLMFAGIGIAIQSPAMIVIVLPVFALAELLYVLIEEAVLVRRHGDAYRYYRGRTGLIVPRFYHWLKIPAMVLCRTVFSYRILYRERIPINPPFFIIAAHRNYLDPFIIATAISYPIHYVTTFEMFRTSLSRFLFSHMFCIPRKRYLNDTAATRQVVRLVNQGAVIGLFPEGERSWNGAMLSFKPEVLKLVRKYSHVPVLPVRLEGNYLAWPRWGKGVRRAHVTVTIEEPIHLDPDWELARIEQKLFEKVQSHDTDTVCYSRNRAVDLCKVIYRCPCCMSLAKMVQVDGQRIWCSGCSTQFTLSPRYELLYEHKGEKIAASIDKVYRMVHITGNDIRQESNETVVEIHHSNDVTLFIDKGTRFVSGGSGSLLLTNKSLGFSVDTHTTMLEVPLSSIQSVTIESNCKLQVYDGKRGALYQCMFANESALMWQDYIIEAVDKLCGTRPNAC
jgi:1-acyl-sn-glycerol-3-phosphate acyltransferase